MWYQVSKRVDARTEAEVALGAFQWYRWITLAVVNGKAKAIALADAQPVLTTVNINATSTVVYRNEKPAEVNYRVAHNFR